MKGSLKNAVKDAVHDGMRASNNAVQYSTDALNKMAEKFADMQKQNSRRAKGLGGGRGGGITQSSFLHF